MAQIWHKNSALVRACSDFSYGQNHHSILITGGVSSANNHRNLWIHSVASDSDFPRPVHCAVPAMRVNGMMTNQISDPTISNIDESLDVNVGMTPTTRGKEI